MKKVIFFYLLSLVCFIPFLRSQIPTTKERDVREKYVASVIVLEAGGEGRMGMIAVTNVIGNRAFKKYGRKNDLTLFKIASQKWQFSCTNGKTVAQVIARGKKHLMFAYALQLVRRMENNGLTDITDGALYYHTVNVFPKWDGTMIRTCRINHHVFFKP